jgi:hypothetical protein
MKGGNNVCYNLHQFLKFLFGIRQSICFWFCDLSLSFCVLRDNLWHSRRAFFFFLQDESKSLELTACKSVIRCVEACQLVSVFNIDSIKRKVARIEKEKADRKKLGSANRFQNKRARGAAGPQSFPAAKSARGSGSSYRPSFQNPVSRSFGYAARSAGYASPAAAQAHYAPGSVAARRGGVLYGGPGAAFGSVAHNYGAGAAQQPYHR